MAAKFAPGTLVKMCTSKETYYNYVVDSYYNEKAEMELYRLDEVIAMPVYREDWLEAVSDAEVTEICNSGRLQYGKRGGWVLPAQTAEAVEQAQTAEAVEQAQTAEAVEQAEATT